MRLLKSVTGALHVACALGIVALSQQSLHAVIAPTTETTITVNGEALGTEFDDWALVPIAYTDPSDNTGAHDINTVQVAHDIDNVYVRATVHSTTPVDLTDFYIGFDSDNDASTGYDMHNEVDVGGAGLVGTEFFASNDFPVGQNPGSVWAGGAFNTAVGAFPGWTSGSFLGTSMEWAIPRNIENTSTGSGPLFSGNTFDVVIWSWEGDSDGTVPITYSFTAVPEPTSLVSLTSLGLLALASRRRRNS